jgi:hypothetical protein
MNLYFGVVSSGAPPMPELLPIRLRLPVITGFPELKFMNFNDLVLIPFCFAPRPARCALSLPGEI